VGFPSLGRRHPDPSAFNREQQLCRERYMEGKSCHWGLEHGDELDAHYGA